MCYATKMNDSHNVLIFDFDSTLVAVESLDELSKIVLDGAIDKDERVRTIRQITDAGMAGEIGFEESLSKRFAQIKPHQSDIQQLVEKLLDSVSVSVWKYESFLKQNADDIWIVSGGFKDFIDPVAIYFGISPDHVIANQMVWGEDGYAVGYDTSLPLAHDNGKVAAIKALNFSSDVDVVMVGDGMTDYAVYEARLAGKFIAYTENVRREAVAERSDFEVSDFGELLRILGYDPSN